MKWTHRRQHKSNKVDENTEVMLALKNLDSGPLRYDATL
jgi:hypothetical protein